MFFMNKLEDYISKNNSENITFCKKYFKYFNDLSTTILLSRIVFWFSPNKSKKIKLRIKKEGKYWLAKKRDDWVGECCLTKNQFDRSIKILEKNNLVETKIFKFMGEPTKHIWLNVDKFIELFGE